MKLFLLFIFVCFGIAIVFKDRDIKTNLWMLGGLSILVAVGYFFFHQI